MFKPVSAWVGSTTTVTMPGTDHTVRPGVSTRGQQKTGELVLGSKVQTFFEVIK